MITISGKVERITFFNPDTRFTIARVQDRGSGRPVTIIGTTHGLSPGETLTVSGTWEEHPRFGQQLKIHSLESSLPASADGILEYLASGLIPGIGPKTAARLVAHFQEETLSVMDNAPERLVEVSGIGAATAARIAESWASHHALRRLMGFLQEHGVKLSFAPKIFSLYAEDAVTRLREDPYVLAVDWPGTGFVIADTIARHQGADPNDPHRIAACLANTVDQFVTEGNVYAPEDKLIDKCEDLFGIDNESAKATLDELQNDGTLIAETTASGDGHRAVYPVVMHEAETALANRLRALHTVPSLVPDMDADRIVAEIVDRLSIHLSEEQAGVLASIIHRKVAILTGGPGTGKTTLVRAITVLSEALGREVVLAAPTGRAARRLGAMTQRNAYTIHRLLGWNPVEGLLERDRDNPIEADVIIVDEASMVDLMLMHYLVEAIPMASSLILVGDIHQLPPVGPGNVLEEMMRSGVVETFSLTEVFRQAMESPIIVNAHRVRNGEPPILPRADGADDLSEFYFVEARTPDHAVDTIVELCTRLIPRHFNLDPMADIQVLTPMHKGTAGTINLNKVLQGTLNPHPEDENVGAARFHPGDKVIHLKNNYRKDVFNGDIGLVESVDPAAERLNVDYDGRLVEYLFEELHELSLAYAITVHKSQGSEYPCTVVLLMTQHYPMLQRNLLYTAMTRGKELVVIVGMQKALATALRNDRPAKRRSRLSERLTGLGRQ